MKIYTRRIMKNIQIITAILVGIAILYFIIGEIFGVRENPFYIDGQIPFNSGWEMVLPDGERLPIKVPGAYDVDQGERFVIEKKLPENFDGTWICTRSSQHDMKMYIDGELIDSYDTKDTRKFGKNSVSVFVFVELLPEYAGKTFSVELVSHSTYSGYVNEFFSGDRDQIWMVILYKYLPVTIFALFMLFLSIMVVMYCIIVRVAYRKSVDIFYLGIGLLVASMWLIAESKLRQLFLPNSTIASIVGFLMVMILPLPFLAYANNIQNRRYEKAYVIMGILTIINTIASCGLQFVDVKDFSETMGSAHVLIVALILMFFVTIILDMKKRYIKAYREVAIGMLGMMVAGIGEVYMVYDKFAIDNGIMLCMGLVLLLFMAVIKTGKDLIEIEKEKQIAVAASESKALFLANMSHEIRTPINTIMGMNEMILRENHNNATREYAKNIESASKMLIGLIDDILDFSKLDAGKIEICDSPYNVAAMLNDVVLALKVRLEKKGLKLKVDIDENIPTMLCGDELRIKQIMNNLLSNAVKYTDKGLIMLSATGYWSKGKYYSVFSVKDTGVGIKEADLPKLFDSFQRMDLNRNKYIQGTGLGLSITKQLVEIMDGTIKVESEYGKGSCFTVTIHQEVVSKNPLGDLPKAYTEVVNFEDEREDVLFSSDAKVLVVDDNEMNLKVMKALLGKTGIDIDYASGGIECYEKCKRVKYDLIFMDHMMPAPDGVETLHMIKSDKDGLNLDTNVIVLTANAIKGVKEEYVKEGFIDYISKPVEYETLEIFLMKYLGKYMEGNEMALDKEKGLAFCGGMPELYEEILQTYIEKGKQYDVELDTYYKECNWKEYARVAHTLKSTSLTIGADDFSELAKKHEFAAKEENIDFINESYDNFKRELKNIISVVENQL